MNPRKVLFPFMLMLAIVLTGAGLITFNKSFSITDEQEVKPLNLHIDNFDTKRVDVLGVDNTSVSYIINFDESKREYKVSFDMINDSSFDMKLINTYMDEIPDELKGIVSLEIARNSNLNKNDKDRITLKYTIKDNLTEEEKGLINKYKKLKMNMIFNYTQA